MATGQGKSTGTTRKASPAVYRRRRVVVLGGLLVVLALVAWGFFGVVSLVKGAGKSDAAASPTTTTAAASPTSFASATPSPTSATPVCDLGKIRVTAGTDKKVYGPKENPVLTLKVTNDGTVACPVNVGTSQMEFLISSGQDRVFSSQDCADKPTDLTKTLAPGASETANFVWQRNRSVEGCKVVSAVPGAGGATYVFQATLGQVTSPKAIFQLG
ncbi:MULTISPECIES: hypothetical protein [Arthrobacter]|uniref:DUF4232 domain-containing protein n=2 Tax=Arthrobacter TaxID=1663 RepID=A0ABU9KIM0_9MICC|nr:hypothetical protein [Arthrobacter sp. YJM1]MDP5227012.1 hypothetical protein [Arthrobacter sp. YJM1]